MMIETARLKIIPLTPDQFALLLEGQSLLEKALGLEPSGHDLEEHTQSAMEGLYTAALCHQDQYYWYTNWQIVLRAENVLVGSACFVGGPNENGEVEIGYGMNQPFRCRGYMTEAVRAMCAWAFGQDGVRAVVAGTEMSNGASGRVLEKSGMNVYKEDADCLWWRLDRAEFQ